MVTYFSIFISKLIFLARCLFFSVVPNLFSSLSTYIMVNCDVFHLCFLELYWIKIFVVWIQFLHLRFFFKKKIVSFVSSTFEGVFFSNKAPQVVKYLIFVVTFPAFVIMCFVYLGNCKWSFIPSVNLTNFPLNYNAKYILLIFFYSLHCWSCVSVLSCSFRFVL